MNNDRFPKTVLRGPQAIQRTLAICGAILVLASLTAVAQDNTSATITLTGRNVHHWAPPGCVGFYDNICGGGYQGNIGWNVSDGSPVNFEYSPSARFTASKTGASTKITLGLGYVAGTNAVGVVLTRDCGGAPCTTPDGIPKWERLCSGMVSAMPKFGSTHTTTVSVACRAQIVKGQKYWVILQSFANSELEWNYSNSATGPVYLGEMDSWFNNGTQPVGALTVE